MSDKRALSMEMAVLAGTAAGWKTRAEKAEALASEREKELARAQTVVEAAREMKRRGYVISKRLHEALAALTPSQESSGPETPPGEMK